MKVVINKCYGGFGLSRKAIKRYLELTGKECFCKYDIPRNDNDLVRVVEELAGEANNRFSKLKIVDIPDDVEFIIEEYDGIEWVSERHRTWY